MGSVLIVGATSGIARAIAVSFARRKWDLVLAGRDTADLKCLAADLAIRFGVRTAVRAFEADAYESHHLLFEDEPWGVSLTGVIVCHGYMGSQNEAESSIKEARKVIDVNYSSYVSVLHLAASYLGERDAGFICALASVAALRGRQSNYMYGSAKAALVTFLQGLRSRMARSQVRVVTVLLGVVDTKMTYGVVRPGPLVATPERVAERVVRGIQSGRDVFYVPGFWYWIMLGIRMIPERVFKYMRL